MPTHRALSFDLLTRLVAFFVTLTAACSSDPAESEPGSAASTGSGGGGGAAAATGAGGGDATSTGAGGQDEAALDAIVTAKMAEAHMLGLSTCLVKNAEVVWCKGYGMADIEANRPVTTDTPFLIASISKTITATTLMQLWQDGLFDLDEDAAADLPFTLEHPTSSEPLTYRRLLTHTASVSDNWDVIDGFYDYEGEPDISLFECVSGYFDPAGPYYDASNFLPDAPGSAYEYSNMGIALAGLLAEQLTGTDFAALSTANVLQPLGMTRSSWHITDFSPGELAMPYAWEGGAYEAYGQYTFADYPDGGLRATAPDLARFLAAIAAGGALDGVQILAPETLDEMLKVQFPGLDSGQGLVFYRTTMAGDEWIGHNGGESGVSTDMFYRESDGLGFVLLMNGDADDDDTPIVELEEALIAFGEGLP
jgi:CubicO group peptidase (beta-lactamase class C family)